MIVAGVGCRKGTPAAEIEAAIVAACARAGVAPSELRVIATSAGKRDEPGIAAAASAIGVPLVLIPQGDLTIAGGRAATRSERVMALAGVPSVAEAAALAAAGPAARLIAPRIAIGPVTCALAEAEGVMGAYEAAASSLSVGRTLTFEESASSPSLRLPSRRLRPSEPAIGPAEGGTRWTGYGEGRGEGAVPQVVTRGKAPSPAPTLPSDASGDGKGGGDLSPQAGRGEASHVKYGCVADTEAPP